MPFLLPFFCQSSSFLWLTIPQGLEIRIPIEKMRTKELSRINKVAAGMVLQSSAGVKDDSGVEKSDEDLEVKEVIRGVIGCRKKREVRF